MTPWGAPHVITGAATLHARLPGQWYQLEAGLHYNWHRSYDPSLGRYTQPDPLGFVDGPSVYGYARGAPTRLVDRDGRDTFVVINRNGYTHAGVVVIGAAGQNALYDPGGSYRAGTIGSGQALFDSDVNLRDYVNFQLADGPKVEVIRFLTATEEEKAIVKSIEDYGGCKPLYCAQCTSAVLNNSAAPFINLGSFFLPSSLGNELKRRGGSVIEHRSIR